MRFYDSHGNPWDTDWCPDCDQVVLYAADSGYNVPATCGCGSWYATHLEPLEAFGPVGLARRAPPGAERCSPTTSRVDEQGWTWANHPDDPPMPAIKAAEEEEKS